MSYAEAYVFNAFLTQTNNSLQLSLLSLIRHHTVQSYLNLRTSIESTTLACYSLYQPDEYVFIKRHDTYKDILIEQTNVKNMANKWLDQTYAEHSKKLKLTKTDNINKYYAHSSLTTALMNIDYDIPDLSMSNFFDKIDIFTLKFQLMLLANSAITQIDLISKVLIDYPRASLISDFDAKLTDLFTKNHDLYQEIIKDPIYARFNF